LWEYVEEEFAAALEALGLHVGHDPHDGVTVAFAAGGLTTVRAHTRLPDGAPGYPNGRAVYIHATTDEEEGLSEKAWRSEALPALERAAEATGNVVYAPFYWRSMGNRPLKATIVPSWFPRQRVIVAAFSNEERKTAAAVMSENRFRVPQEYRKQIGALLQQAAETNDLGIYMQAKELAAMVAT
jgi:hypothetical protein